MTTRGKLMEWIDVRQKRPKGHPHKTTDVVMVDVEAGLVCFLGWYDHSEKGGGFYFRDGNRAVRVICTHYIELPKRPERTSEEDTEMCMRCSDPSNERDGA